MWGGVGGHAEPSELNEPRLTCLREIFEETGIEENQLTKLDLKYIVLRQSAAEIILMYYFIGRANSKNYTNRTKEGNLFWINEDEVLDRQMSFEIRNTMTH